MSQDNEKALARQRFLALIGKSALGLWLLQMIPSGLTALKPPTRKPSRNQVASRVKMHPMAVKRETRG